MAGKISTYFGYDEIKAEYNSKSSLNSFNEESFMVIDTMRIDRYHSSMKEETSSMTKDATRLLDEQDYIGFFKSCGSSYVRSIRRAQEITSIFKFSTPSIDLAQEFASDLNVLTQSIETDASFANQAKFISIADSLDIKIVAFGLGLNPDGSGSLTSTSLEEYSNILAFSFKSFTQTEDSGNIGMVYALEFVPWVDNAEFQITSKILDENIEILLPRSLIPKANPKSGDTDAVFMNNDSTRSQFECKDSFYRIDKYGYCCEEEVLFNIALRQYESEEQDVAMSSRVCKPIRKLETSVVKNNMSNNGEFVARLDSVVQYKLNQLFTLQTCLDSVNSFSEKYDNHILKSTDTAKYDASVEGKFTVRELKKVLDPLNDYSLIRHMSNELDEFIDMFYRPCIAALFGTNIGSSSDIEPKYFMAHGWLTHDACAKISCLADNMRWNRDGSGCIESLITGNTAPMYEDYIDSECKKDDEDNSIVEFEVCKYKSNELIRFQTSTNTCWGTQIIPHYLIEHFCMPEITAAKNYEGQQGIQSDTCMLGTLTDFNVALSSNGGSATQSTTGSGGLASYAIDGVTDGAWGSGITATAYAENSWWKVTLTSTYSISKVIVYVRTDSCCNTVNTDFTMKIYNGGTEVYNSADSNPDESSTVKEFYTFELPGIDGDEVEIANNNPFVNPHNGQTSQPTVQLAEVVVIEERYL